MSDGYFGWQPASIPYVNVADDYVVHDYSDPNQRYEPTVWDKETTSIETMWGWIRNESDERVTAVADMWHRISVLLECTRTNLQRYATALAARWQSPAGEYFMQRVGATLYSLDEWKEAADSNRRGLEQLAGKIESTQQEFRTLWEQYTVEAADPDNGLQWSDTYDWIPGVTGRTRRDVMDDYFERARDIVKPLADMYIDVYLSHITRGSTFRGPTDAAVVDPSVTFPGGPGAPPRPEFAGRGEPTTAPGLGMVTLSPAPPPVLPDGLHLTGGTVAPPTTPPPMPNLSQTGAGPTLSPAQAVMPPGGTAGPRPVAPGVNRPGPPPGINRPVAAVRPPGPPRPALPGAGGPPPNHPATRGPAPQRPVLPGSTGGRPSGGRPRLPQPAAPGPAGRPAPAAPRLSGRSGPTKPGGTAKGPGPVLGGQRGPGLSGGAGRSGRKTDDRQQTLGHGDGDDELWQTDPAAPGTIDTPDGKRPQEQSRSLGQR